ncbi:MAG: HlyD family efflux transporter periplasmic adaptor subunit [Sphingobacteriia bacterium]|nr:HlyD family efflux transporter periplasmic adaptor subunit [Sphingobacteriia bacterium]
MPDEAMFLQRSSSFNDIISHKQGFIAKWGLVLIAFLLLIILILAYFIQYPDVIVTRAKLNATSAPKEIKTRVAGKLIKLFVKEGETIKEGTIIGFMESTALHEKILLLNKKIESLQKQLAKNDQISVLQFPAENTNSLGELQQSYQTLVQAWLLYKQYLPDGFYNHKLTMLRTDESYLQKHHDNLMEQKNLQEEDLQLYNETYAANEQLGKQKVLAPVDVRNEKSKLLNKKLNIPQIASTLIDNESQQHSKQKEIAELENQIAQQKNTFIEAVNTFKAQVEGWKQQYVLVSPTQGIVSFTSFIQEKQLLLPSQSVCYIKPSNTEMYAELLIPQNNFGKVKLNQKVIFRLNAFPYQEYGFIEGRLNYISAIPTDSGYAASALLPQQLNSNYRKQLTATIGLSAEADIVTQKRSLLQRIFNNLKTLDKY